MTKRTRWDALAEELELKDEPADPPGAAHVASDPPTTSSSEGLVTWGVLRARFERPDAEIQVLVMLMVDGVSIGPVTDVSITTERPYDEERSRSYGVGAVGPLKVSGSFLIPVTNGDALLSGRDMMLALIRDDGNSYFKIHAVKMTWSTSSGGTTTRVDFVGAQVD